jgi:hypothetical protein
MGIETPSYMEEHTIFSGGKQAILATLSRGRGPSIKVVEALTEALLSLREKGGHQEMGPDEGPCVRG